MATLNSWTLDGSLKLLEVFFGCKKNSKIHLFFNFLSIFAGGGGLNSGTTKKWTFSFLVEFKGKVFVFASPNPFLSRNTDIRWRYERKWICFFRNFWEKTWKISKKASWKNFTEFFFKNVFALCTGGSSIKGGGKATILELRVIPRFFFFQKSWLLGLFCVQGRWGLIYEQIVFVFVFFILLSGLYLMVPICTLVEQLLIIMELNTILT